ncbi:MAG: carbonate dehydratase [Epsilonproteobacteria bacterium (ex Lamellibrachia satsuma)]|nr:MAG: carbonate dehydratase [Epsilonproteobacteria bacterium (ex Lamellibrachia satsuma)]
MKNITSILLVSSMALMTGCATDEAHNAHWGYTGHNTPETWGHLSDKYRECGVGLNQSPINITHSLHAHLPPLVPSYGSSSKNITDNGHTVQVNMLPGSTLTMDGKTFELKQFHFHSPSENHINGKSFPLEAHFVHLDKQGNIAVVAVMFEEGKSNKALEKVWSKMPAKEGETNILKLSKIAQALLPKEKHYYRFNGSLTTPPCTEGVRWFVLKTPVTVSKEQVGKFHHLMHYNNNRPIQPLDARIVID